MTTTNCPVEHLCASVTLSVYNTTGTRTPICSPSGVNRTKKGRQALTRRTVGRSSPLGNSHSSNYTRTTESTSSAILLTTQSSSTQTDMRDSEIQTDPWWHRSEGTTTTCFHPFPWYLLSFLFKSNKHCDVTGYVLASSESWLDRRGPNNAPSQSRHPLNNE